MKLFYTPNSPYARIARIAVHEFGLGSSVQQVLALNRQDDNPVLQYSPVGRVPTLVADGTVITEIRSVVDYIATRAGHENICGASANDWKAVEQEGQILWFLDGIVFWVRENRRGELRSKDLIEVEAKRCGRCLDYLNTEVSESRLPGFPAFRSMVLASALDLMDLHAFSPHWKSQYIVLSAWFAGMAIRPSMLDTRPDIPVSQP